MKVEKIKIICLSLLLKSIAFGTTNSNMVWEQPTSAIERSITGPVAKGIALIAIVVAAISWAITDGGNMMGKAIRIVAALAIVGGAATLISSLFGISGGAIFL